MLSDMMAGGKACLIGHSHPGEDLPVASKEDRQALRKIGQQKSRIISGRTGVVIEFGQDRFDE